MAPFLGLGEAEGSRQRGRGSALPGKSSTLPGAYWHVIQAGPRLALGWEEEICANLLAHINQPVPALLAQPLPDKIRQPGQSMPRPALGSKGTSLPIWTLPRHCGSCCSAEQGGQ